MRHFLSGVASTLIALTILHKPVIGFFARQAMEMGYVEILTRSPEMVTVRIRRPA